MTIKITLSFCLSSKINLFLQFWQAFLFAENYVHHIFDDLLACNVQ